MSKIKLDLDALQVESFNTTVAGEARRGTVLARLLPPTPGCSAVDACPTRLCTDRC